MGTRHQFQTLMVFVALAFWTLAGDTTQPLKVQQPPYLDVMEGGTAVLQCTYNLTEKTSKPRASWQRKTGLESVDVGSPLNKGRLNLSKLEQNREGEATLTISEVWKNDSGIYHCSIEGVDDGTGKFGVKGKGGGTRLRVIENPAKEEPRGRHSGTQELLPVVFPPVALFIVIIVGIALVRYLRTRRGRTSQRQQNQITNECSGAQRETQMAAEAEDGIHYAQINLRKSGSAVPSRKETHYAQINPPKAAPASRVAHHDDDIHYARLDLLKTRTAEAARAPTAVEGTEYAAIAVHRPA